MARTVSLAALLLVLACAPAAHAGSVVFVDRGNVFAATPDGATVALTSDGEAETPPATDESTWGRNIGPYSNASADDRGRLLVARKYRAEDGRSSGPAWIWRAADGEVLAANMVSMASCGSGVGSVGPIGGRVDPTGTYVAFSYFCNYGPPNWTVDLRAAINFPDMQTTPANDPPDWSGYSHPTWMGRRLLATDGVRIFAQRDDAQAPITTGWDSWVGTDAPGQKIVAADVARSGGKGIAEITQDGGPDRLALFTYEEPVPGGAVAEQCDLPVADEAGDASWSADGAHVAFRDAEGVKVATAPAAQNTPGEPCTGVTVKLLSATGTAPVFSAHTFRAPDAPGGPGGPGTPGDPGGPGTPGTPGDPPAGGGTAPLALAKAPGRAVRAKAFKRGLKVVAQVGAPGRLSARVTAPRKVARRLGLKKVVASARAAAAAAGPVALKLRLPARARKRAGRLKGARLKLTVAFAPDGGATQKLARAVRVR